MDMVLKYLRMAKLLKGNLNKMFPKEKESTNGSRVLNMKDIFIKELDMVKESYSCQVLFNTKAISKMICQAEWEKQYIIMVINIMGCFIRVREVGVVT